MDARLHERRIYVPRYTRFQRVNHWVTAILFVLLALSGLSMFYPRLFFLAAPFGDGEGARRLHPWLGVALAASFVLLAVPLLRSNFWNRDDVRWMRHIRSVMSNDEEGVPELGKYNAGQKGVYWSQALLLLVLLVTGLLVWQVYFGHLTSIPTQRIALLVHSLAGVLAITVIIVHIYAGIWTKGTGRAMTRGSVTGGWAYIHHRRWLRDSLAQGAVRSRSGLHGNE